MTPLGGALVDQVTKVRRAEIAAILARMDTADAVVTVASMARFNAAAGEVADADWAATIELGPHVCRTGRDQQWERSRASADSTG